MSDLSGTKFFFWPSINMLKTWFFFVFCFWARGSEKTKKAWKTQVEKESKSVGLEKEDALNRAKWRVRVGEIAVKVG